MYLACAMAKHHHDDGEGAVDIVIMMLHKIPSNSFAKSFFLCLCGRFFFFFFVVSCLLCAQTDLPISEARQTQWPSWGLSMGGHQAAI